MDEEIAFPWSPRWMQRVDLADLFRHCIGSSSDVVDRPAGENPARCVEIPAKPPLARVARGPQLLGVGESQEERIPSWIETSGRD